MFPYSRFVLRVVKHLGKNRIYVVTNRQFIVLLLVMSITSKVFRVTFFPENMPVTLVIFIPFKISFTIISPDESCSSKIKTSPEKNNNQKLTKDSAVFVSISKFGTIISS